MKLNATQFEAIIFRMDRITQLLIQGEKKMSAEFDALTAQVAASTTVETSAVTLIQGIAARLVGNPSPAQVSALAASLKSSADALAAAVAANTDAAPVTSA
jgi:hypothetical protein